MRGRGTGVRLVHEVHAQATVEMAVVAPVLIVLALVIGNLGVFTAASARFDRVAPDIVIAHGVSPVSGSGHGSIAASTERVRTEIETAMGNYPIEVEVTCSDAGGSSDEGPQLALVGALRTFTCTMRYRPWPAGLTVADVSMGAPPELIHERTVKVDPWRPGVLL